MGYIHKSDDQKTIVVTTEIVESFNSKQQKGRRVPIHLQERVEQEIKEIGSAKSCKKMEKSSEMQFISPIVITVKRINR